MGAAYSTSKSTNEMIVEVITNVIVQNTSNCNANIQQAQTISTGNSGGNIVVSGNKQSSDSKIHLSCISATVNDSNFQSSIAQAIKQAVESKTSGFSAVSVADSEAISKSITKVSASVNMQNITNCISQLSQNQILTTGNATGNISIIDNSQTLTAEVLQKCISNDQTTMSAVNELSQVVDQSAKSSNEGLLGGSFVVIAVVVVIALIVMRKKN